MSGRRRCTDEAHALIIASPALWALHTTLVDVDMDGGEAIATCNRCGARLERVAVVDEENARG